MTTKNLICRLFATVLLAGCADAKLHAIDEAAPATAPDTTTGSTSQGLTAELRLRAVNAGDFQSLLVRAKRIEVRADDRLLGIDETGLTAELTRETQAWKLGTFQLPQDAREVRVTLDLDDVAAFEGASTDAAAALDMKGTRIDFTLPAEYVAQHAKAVVVLDASRSVLDLGNGRFGLVPQYQVMH